MTRLDLSEEAERDLTALYLQGIEMFGRAQADRYIDGLLETLDLIADYPEIARLRDEIDPPVRVCPYRSHIVLYDLNERGGVLVVRIRHAHEDWINNPT